jgi:primase-polymerase (primpol)-like protein
MTALGGNRAGEGARCRYCFDHLPPVLRKGARFVLWRYESNVRERPTKVPYQVNGCKASTTNPAHWSTFGVASNTFNNGGGYDGIGFVLNNDEFVGIDLDHCVDDDGNVEPWAQAVADSIDSYTEISPSGHGLRIFARVEPGAVPLGRRHGHVEVYGTARYLTLTGRALAQGDVAYRHDEVLALLATLPQRTASVAASGAGALDEADLEATERTMLAAVHAHGRLGRAVLGDLSAYSDDNSRADLALASFLHMRCGGDLTRVDRVGRASGLYRPKWDERRGTLTYWQQTMRIGSSHGSSVAERRVRDIEGQAGADDERIVIGDASMVAEADRPPLFPSIDAMVVDAVFTAAAGGAVVLLSKPHVAYKLALFSTLTAASKFYLAGSDKPVKIVAAWICSEHRKTVDSLAFAPGEARFCRDPGNPYLRAVNMWSPFDRSQYPRDWEARVGPFLQHIYYVIPNREDAGRFLDWLAHVEQYPGVLPHSHWLLVAPKQGVGRNWISAALGRVWPGAVAAGGELDNILGATFNGLIAQKLMCVLDEVRVGDGAQWRHAEKLKGQMTATHREINLKYGAQYVELNCLRWLMFSNHRDAMPLSPEDRRVNVSEWSGQVRDERYYADLYQMLDDALFIQSVARFLAERDIRDFNPGRPAPLNQAKRDMIQNTKSEMTLKVEALIVERSEAGPRPSTSDVITVARAWNEIGDGDLSPEFKRQYGTQLNKALLGAGAVRYPNRFRLDRVPGVQTVWFLRNAAHWLAQPIEKIKEAAMTGPTGGPG